MEDFDLIKAFDEVINTTYPPKEAALNNTTEVPEPTSLESILPRARQQDEFCGVYLSAAETGAAPSADVRRAWPQLN
jgi:hypothetical protein